MSSTTIGAPFASPARAANCTAPESNARHPPWVFSPLPSSREFRAMILPAACAFFLAVFLSLCAAQQKAAILPGSTLFSTYLAYRKGAIIGHLNREANIGAYESADDAAESIENAYASVARILGAHSRNVAIVENST